MKERGLFHVDCRSRAHTDVYADAAQSSQHTIETLLYVICWLLVRFLLCCSSLQQNHMTAERRGVVGGRRLTAKVPEKKKKKKKTSAGDRESKAEEKKIKWNWKCSILSAVEEQQETVVVTKTNPVLRPALEVRRMTGNKRQLSKFNPIRADQPQASWPESCRFHQIISFVSSAQPRRRPRFLLTATHGEHGFKIDFTAT